MIIQESEKAGEIVYDQNRVHKIQDMFNKYLKEDVGSRNSQSKTVAFANQVSASKPSGNEGNYSFLSQSPAGAVSSKYSNA